MPETKTTGRAGYRRYAIYVVPDGPFYETGASWLGWDSLRGVERPHPDGQGLLRPVEALTATPRKYGFHGTIKPPFRLAQGTDPEGLHAALTAFCATRAPVTVPGLAIGRLGGFVAVLPEPPAPQTGLADLAAATVAALDPFRAPHTEAELARRRGRGLTPRQDMLLLRWGYPHVMEEFRFHMTLTGRLPDAEAEMARAALAVRFAHVMPRPWRVDSLCLLGEAEDGLFHVLDRYPLGT